MGKRYNMHGMRLLLRVDEESTCSVPPQWTDEVEADPEIVLGNRRALARVADFIGLADLIAALLSERSKLELRKVKDAAIVKKKMSHASPHFTRDRADISSSTAVSVTKTLDMKSGSGVFANTKEQTKERCRPGPSAAIRKRKRSSGRAR